MAECYEISKSLSQQQAVDLAGWVHNTNMNRLFAYAFNDWKSDKFTWIYIMRHSNGHKGRK